MPVRTPDRLTGLGALVRLTIRRNRWFYTAWVAGLAAIVPATAAAYETIIDPENADLLIATLSGNPTMRAMLGPPTDLSSAGGFTVWRVGTFVATMAALMALLGVVRSTRGEEEEGRVELLRSGVVGRHAPLLAGVLVALGAAGLLGLLISVSMAAVGTPVVGSVAFGVGTALVAMVFAGVGAVTAQVAATSRAARGLSLWVLGGAYLLRALADGSAEGSGLRDLSWASPLQWMALSRPYAQERWLVLLLPAVLTVALVAGAVALEARRDHGAGLRAARRGPDRASATLGSPLGLAWRLQRGSLLAWTVGMVIFALAMGSLSTGFGEMLREAPILEEIFRRMGGGTEQLTEAFFVAILGIVAVLMGVLSLMVFHRLATEERRGHAELVLATETTRPGLLASHLLIAAAVPVGLLAAVGGLLAVAYARSIDDWSQVLVVAGAALALAPGGLLLLGAAVLLHGWAPRWSWVVWLVVGWSLFVVWVGSTLGLPDWLTRLTPWAALPQLPAQAMSWPPVLVSLVVAASLTVMGAVGFRRRDIG
jgi:ABC-2 type transport system permease protein